MAKDKNWIEGAVKRPGALKAKAKKASALKPDGTISKAWLREKAKAGGLTGKQARLATTLEALREKRKR